MIVLINLVFMILVFRFFKIQEHDRSSISPYGRSNAPFKIKFVIPIGTVSKEDAEKTLKELISDYKQEIKIDDLFLPS